MSEYGTVGDRLGIGRWYRRLRRAGAAAVGIAFWGWLLVRWINDWTGGLFVPRGTPFIDPANLPVGPQTASVLAEVPTLASGIWLTLVLTIASIALGFVIAIPVSVVRVYGGHSRYLSLGFTELIRGTPLLVQLFVLYYGLQLSSAIRQLPGVGTGVIPDQAVWVGIIGFTINSAAYQAEYIRSALVSVESGQLTAARAIGLSKLGGIRYVVLPQALRYAIPGWSNELIYLIKYSSLGAFITVPELFNQAEGIGNETFAYTKTFLVVAVCYLAIVITASKIMARIEDRTAIPGLGQSGDRPV